jgi:hypothetical protein
MRLALLLVIAPSIALAGPALDDNKPTPPNDTAGSPTALTAPEPAADKESLVEFGVGIRLRSVYVPKFILELFVDRAADGAQNFGYGVEVVRRRGDVELQLGVEFEHINVGEGVWINKGDTVPTNSVDYILSPDHSGNQFGWFTIDFTFLHHTEINKFMNFRVGAGLGLGIITGELDHYNVVCAAGSTNTNPEPGCVPPDNAAGGRTGGLGTDEDGHGFQQKVKYDMPPVFPVVNAIIGLQFKPVDKMTINVEAGIRTLPFLGVDAAYFF